jgi:hypothetical protein
MAFNEGAVKSLFPATLRYIAAVVQRSDTDGPNLGIAGALELQRRMIRSCAK